MTRSDQARKTQVASGPWVVLEWSWETLEDGRLGSSLWPIGGPNKTKSFPKRQNYSRPLGLLSEFLLKGLGTWASVLAHSDRSGSSQPFSRGPQLPAAEVALDKSYLYGPQPNSPVIWAPAKSYCHIQPWSYRT